MSDHSLSLAVLVAGSPEKAFAAILDPRAWWGASIEGVTDRLGEEWTYRYADMHMSRQKTIELVPDRKVAWKIVDADMSFIEDRGEWKDTTIVFELTPKGDATEIVFTHVGLLPAVECYDICRDAWTGLVTGSLRSLIETGVGDPYVVEKKTAA